MKIGDMVKIDRCEVCPGIVGKVAKIKGLGDDTVLLNFGRGRPLANCPKAVNVKDVSLVQE